MSNHHHKFYFHKRTEMAVAKQTYPVRYCQEPEPINLINIYIYIYIYIYSCNNIYMTTHKGVIPKSVREHICALDRNRAIY